MLNLSLLFIILRKKFCRMKNHRLSVFIFKVLFNSFIMALIVYISRYFLSLGVDMTKFIGIFLQLIFAFIIGIVVYSILSIIMKLPEADILKRYYGKFEKYLLKKINGR